MNIILNTILRFYCLSIVMIENIHNNNSILKMHKAGQTTIVFTKKALSHILEQHSESNWIESAILKWKICFKNTEEILALADKITNELSSEIEYERSCGLYIPYNSRSVNSIIYRPFWTNLIIQLKTNNKNSFEIVSFYKKRDLKNHHKK